MNLQKREQFGRAAFFILFFFDQAFAQDNAFSWLRKNGRGLSEKRRKRKGRRKGRKEGGKRMCCRAASLNCSDDGEIRRGFRGACFGDDVMQRQPGALGREERKREHLKLTLLHLGQSLFNKGPSPHIHPHTHTHFTGHIAFVLLRSKSLASFEKSQQ